MPSRRDGSPLAATADTRAFAYNKTRLSQKSHSPNMGRHPDSHQGLPCLDLLARQDSSRREGIKVARGGAQRNPWMQTPQSTFRPEGTECAFRIGSCAAVPKTSCVLHRATAQDAFQAGPAGRPRAGTLLSRGSPFALLRVYPWLLSCRPAGTAFRLRQQRRLWPLKITDRD